MQKQSLKLCSAPRCALFLLRTKHSWIFKPCTVCAIAGWGGELRSSIRFVGFCWSMVLPSPQDRLISSDRFLPFSRDVDNLLSSRMRALLTELRHEWEKLEEQIKEVDQEFAEAAKREDSCRRLLTIPGIGPLTATALPAAIGNGTAFRTSRDLAASLGLVPRQHSTSGTARP